MKVWPSSQLGDDLAFLREHAHRRLQRGGPSALEDRTLESDFHRLLWLWGLVRVAARDGGVPAARAALNAEGESISKLAVLALVSGGPQADLQRLQSVTDEELGAVVSQLPQIEKVLVAPVAMAEPTAEIQDEDPEAGEWLSAGEEERSLAGNRFDTNEEAADFVADLYRAGATKVVIAVESIRTEAQGLYADAIRVALPSDSSARSALIELVNQEAENEGYDPEEDNGQASVYLWWD